MGFSISAKEVAVGTIKNIGRHSHLYSPKPEVNVPHKSAGINPETHSHPKHALPTLQKNKLMDRSQEHRRNSLIICTIGLYRLNTHIGVTIWLSSLVIIILPAKGDQVMYIASIQCREMNVMCDHKRAPFH